MRLLLLLLSLFFGGSALAQQGPGPMPENPVKGLQQRQNAQPGNNNEAWRQARSGDPQYTTTTVRGRETDVLIQSWGDTWRRIRNGPVMFYGGWLLVLVIAAILGLYMWKGPVRLHEPLSGRDMVRFTALEMTVHWTTAISFCLLGITGLIMFFGKNLLLPLIGYTLFGLLTQLSKNVHNFVAPLFIVGAAAMVLIWARDNVFRGYDWRWFRRAWAFFMRSEHIPSGRFNAGEKAWFWGGVLVLSVFVTWSGLILLFPNFDQTRATMQDAWIVQLNLASRQAIQYLAHDLGALTHLRHADQIALVAVTRSAHSHFEIELVIE